MSIDSHQPPITPDAPRHNAPASPQPPFRPGPLGRLARLAFRYRGRTVLLWIAAFVVALGLSTAFSGAFDADYSAPGSDSAAAQDLLTTRFPASANDTVTLVAHSTQPVTAPDVRARIDQTLDHAGAVAHVAGFSDPYQNPGALSADGTTIVATLRLDETDPHDMPHESAAALIRIAKDASHDGLTVAVSGVSITNAEAPPIGSEVVGLLAAAVILLLMFGSIVAAGLPILVALAGLAVSSMLTGLIAALLPVPDWSTSLATMIGIGVGIDYALLMVTRFREWRAAGLNPEDTTIATLDTAGRSVLLAGGTVVISMLGLFEMGLSFMRGALVTIAAIVIVLLSAITLFPALLGYFGAHIDRLRLPRLRRRSRKHGSGITAGTGWMRWSQLVQRHRFVATATGLGILLAVASPFLGVHFGFPDSGNSAEGSSTRTAYDLLADGFGPGVNGPLLIIVSTPDDSVESPTGAAALADRVAFSLASTPGVAAVSPAQLNPAADTAIMIVTPATGPQDTRTEDLVRTLRADVIPAAIAGSQATVHVGGATAVAIDSTANISSRIPILIAAVVLLSMLLLLVALPKHCRRGQGRGDEPAVCRRRLRCRRARSAGRLGRAAHRDRPSHPAGPVHPGADVRRAVRVVHGLRGLPGRPDAGNLAGHRQQHAGHRQGPGRHRPGHHRRRSDHDRRVLRVHPEHRHRGEGHRDRHGRSDSHRRHGDPDAPRPRRHALARRPELVAPGPARPRTARGPHRRPPAALPTHQRTRRCRSGAGRTTTRQRLIPQQDTGGGGAAPSPPEPGDFAGATRDGPAQHS